jgi:hypothetical protein
MAVILLDTSVASLFMVVRALYEPYLIGNTLGLSFQSVAVWNPAMRGSRQPLCTGVSRFLRMIVI